VIISYQCCAIKNQDTTVMDRGRYWKVQINGEHAHSEPISIGTKPQRGTRADPLAREPGFLPYSQCFTSWHSVTSINLVKMTYILVYFYAENGHIYVECLHKKWTISPNVHKKWESNIFLTPVGVRWPSQPPCFSGPWPLWCIVRNVIHEGYRVWKNEKTCAQKLHAGSQFSLSGRK